MIDEKYFLDRHTVRSFSGKDVDEALLRKLIEEASHAPNTGNMQLYSVVVTRSAEGKKRLAPLHFNQPCVEDCSMLLTFCIDMNRFHRWCEVSDAVPGFDNVQMLAAAAIDCAMFAQQFNTAAEMRGLGGCFLGTTAYNAPAIAEVLKLPFRVVPLITLALGYPSDGVAVGGTERLPVEALIHDECYTQYSDEQVKNLYADKEARADSKAFVSENGLPNLARVFTDVRYPKQANEQFSGPLLQYLMPFIRH